MNNRETLTLEKVRQLFQKHKQPDPYILNGTCHRCGIDVIVEIFNTTTGYGINGGFVFATEKGQLKIECVSCHKKLGGNQPM